ncbi:MAG: IclR family transcriptional regulator [Magnetospirillum sp.]|nr:IclR family transcriptional regulator [Magnetospirillum sp.]
MKKRVNHKSGGLQVGEDSLAGDRQFAVALHRGLEVLHCLVSSGDALDERELVRRTGLTKPVVSRLVHTLVNQGYMDGGEAEGTYRLGLGVLGLGYECLAGQGLVGALQPFMDELAAYAGEGIMVALGQQDNLSMVYLACTQNAGFITVQMKVGSRISLARSSMGRALLAGLSATDRAALFAQIRTKVGEEQWPAVGPSIQQSVDEVRRQGFCSVLGGWRPDVHAVAVPFHVPETDIPPLAFSCGGPAYLLPRQRLEADLGPRLVEMVRRITALCVGRSAPVAAI